MLQDMHAMLDAAKYADLVLLLIDASFGFEMETFEFLNLLQVLLFAICMRWHISYFFFSLFAPLHNLKTHIPQLVLCRCASMT